MKTLVIHPKDKSTDFLKPIYAGRENITAINSGTKEGVIKAIEAHNHIVMMGHGTPRGLFSVGQFDKKPKPTPISKPFESIPPAAKTGGVKAYSSYQGGFDYEYVRDMTTGYVVDDDMADLLSKKQLTTIWCNADQFIEWNELSGFYTGMFISEVGEARIIGLTDVEQWQVDESNYGFVSVVRRFIDQSPEALYAATKLEYGKMAEYNPVARYNYRRLYVAKEGESNVRIQPEASRAAR